MATAGVPVTLTQVQLRDALFAIEKADEMLSERELQITAQIVIEEGMTVQVRYDAKTKSHVVDL